MNRQLLTAVKRVNRKRNLELTGAQVKKIERRLRVAGFTGDEIALESQVIRYADVFAARTKEASDSDSGLRTASGPSSPRMLGRQPAIAHGFSCPRCKNAKLMSMGIATANTQLPYCGNCRIVVVPAE